MELLMFQIMEECYALASEFMRAMGRRPGFSRVGAHYCSVYEVYKFYECLFSLWIAVIVLNGPRNALKN